MNTDTSRSLGIALSGITINGVEYGPVSTLPAPSPVRIVILQRGWVYVGRWNRDGDDCTLTNALNIRRWGTEKGLGELVEGPRPDTILDSAGTVRFHILGMVASLDAKESMWTALL